MFNINSQVENIGNQMKQMEIQFENLIFQINNYGINNCGTEIQNMGMQMLNAGVQMVTIGIQLPSFASNINQQIQDVLANIQNISLQINNKMQMEIMNNMMMNQMQMPNMNIVFNNKEMAKEEYDQKKKYYVTFNYLGTKIAFNLDEEITIKEMIEMFFKEIGKSKEKLNFYYNAKIININDKNIIKNIFLSNPIPRITVF